MWREPVFRRTGNLTLGLAGCDAVEGAMHSARTHGIEGERLDGAEVRLRFPAIGAPDDFRAFYEPGAGMVQPERAIRLFLETARLRGAVLRFDERVVSWRETGDGVIVDTNWTSYAARRLVLAAGAGCAELLGDGVTRPEPRRVAVFRFYPVNMDPYCALNMPVHFWELPDGSQFYVVPPFESESEGVKAAFHHPLAEALPGRSLDPSEKDRIAMRRVLRSFMPTLAESRVTGEGCLYSMAPESRFMIGPHPGARRVFLACGFSGHGFKFAPVVGEILADLCLLGATPLDIDAFAPA
jgi:sarcosine oxidase